MSMEKRIKIRRMRIQDLERVIEIENQSFSNPWSKDAFIYEMGSGISYPWVVEVDNKIVGYSIHWVIIDEAHLSNIAIDPLYRRMGIGRFLLEKLVESTKKKGAKFITLEVRASNSSAISLYKKMNFKVIGTRKNYYTNPLEDALIMMKSLEE